MGIAVGYADERRAIEAAFQAAWLALDPPDGPAPVELENQPFHQVVGEAWLRLTIISDEGRQVSLGAYPCTRFQGQIVAQVFGPENAGTQAVRSLGDQFLEVWKDAFGRPLELSAGDSGQIRTQHGWMATDGLTEGWYQMRAIVPFTRDIRATA